MVTTPLMPCSQQQPALSALPALCRWPTMDQFIIHSCRSPGKRLRREQAAQASHKLSAKKQGIHPYRSSLGSSLPTVQMTKVHTCKQQESHLPMSTYRSPCPRSHPHRHRSSHAASDIRPLCHLSYPISGMSFVQAESPLYDWTAKQHAISTPRPWQAL